ncbi:4-hydroxy-tetrahydrodipicolinate synthase [Sediminibacillus dalangtanensis]|uniref:4-hydroxy-tetrahydrodipicolinate synthase n=1 Tax=Sediminibacillus dalangtanensis TaxID=2729421 RepID=A0ABX7VSS8_9BACI|nr:4-hydroxy-tetrahydrodipicolinate synthase [Sediminibacillus dalangtanensis]QTM99573.1 4-hydroxy-tetrahydrodipicolinate synthase [Sediminibacillus dalangtanensis]
MDFGRILTAMVTPFDQNGDIDYQKTEILINYLIANGTEGLVVAGTTGESPTLTKDEKLNLLRFTVQTVNKRVPVIAGTGSNNTRDSIDFTRAAEAAGVDASMLVTPYYNKPNQEGMYQHFRSIARAVKLPIMLYNIPGRSAAGMTPETIIKLSEEENIVAVKESGGNLDDMTSIISGTKDSFHLYSGDDGLTLPVLSIGGKGVVSVASHIFGNEMKEMADSFFNGDHQRAATLHQCLLPMMKSLFMAPSPAPVKAALSYVGIDAGSVRLPLVPLGENEKQLLFQQLYYYVGDQAANA